MLWNIVDFRYGKDIRLYDARKMMVDCWDRNSAASNEHWKWQAETSMKYYLIGDVANILRMIGSYLYVGFLAIKGVFSLGVLVQMIQAADELNNFEKTGTTKWVEGYKGYVKTLSSGYYEYFMKQADRMQTEVSLITLQLCL